MPVLQTANEFLGTQTPVLMDIASAAQFPWRRPASQHLGVVEVPQYRIQPNLKQVVVSSNMWQSARAGGPFLFIQALLSTSTVPTYLRDDWYRDWGAIERYTRVVSAARWRWTPSSTRVPSGSSAGAVADRSGRFRDEGRSDDERRFHDESRGMTQTLAARVQMIPPTR